MSDADPSARRRTRDRVLDALEALVWIGLLGLGSMVALEVLRESSDASRNPGLASALPAPEGLIEAEVLPVRATSRGFVFWLQPTDSFAGGRWSGDGHMFAYETRRGDWIDLELPVDEPGSYRVELFLTKASDYGIVAVSVNGARLRDEIDLWSDHVEPTGPLDLGVVALRGRDVLRLEVTGTNPAVSPPRFQFGIDGVRLTRP